MQAEDVKFMFSEMMQRSEQIYLRWEVQVLIKFYFIAVMYAIVMPCHIILSLFRH